MHSIRNALLGTCLAGSVIFLSAPVLAATEVITSTAPPPPRVENVGRPRDGYVWAPGHWEWSGSYRWVSGGWIIAHGKSHWVADAWEPLGDKWHFVPGHWAH